MWNEHLILKHDFNYSTALYDVTIHSPQLPLPLSLTLLESEQMQRCLFYICTRIAQPITWAQSDRYTKSPPSQPVHVQWVMVVKKKICRCAIGWENLERPATVPNWWKLWHKEVATFTLEALEGEKKKEYENCYALLLHLYLTYNYITLEWLSLFMMVLVNP